MDTLSYTKFLARFTDKAYKDDCPIVGSFELTPLCNFNCKMCYVHLQDNSVKNKILSGNQWINLMKEAVDRGMLNAMLTGGEAMMHPDFWDIYMYLINKGISPRIKTNGFLLTKENIEKFIVFPPYLIDVSLYGCNSDSYLAVTGVDAYQKVVDNIHMAIDSGLQLRIMITPSIYMEPWTKDVMELAKSFGSKVVVNDILIEPSKDTGRSKREFELGKREKQIIQMKKELFSSILISEEEDIYSSIEKRSHVPEKGLYCNGGRTSFSRNWDGTMSPCIGFPRDIVCANPIEDGFNLSWDKINVEIKNFSIPQKCHYCSINTKCHYCPTQHSKMASKRLCDSDVCSYWHNYYQ